MLTLDDLRAQANVGADALNGIAARRMGYGPQLTRKQAHTTGFTPPGHTFEKMREMDQAAAELNSLIRVNSQVQVFKDAWAAYYTDWLKFFNSLQGEWKNTAKLGTLFYSDELAAEVERHRVMQSRFRTTYQNEVRPNGEPVPQPSVPEPAKQPEVQQKEDGESPGWKLTDILPWWGWAVVGAGVVGAGVLTYIYIKREANNLTVRKRNLEGLLPDLMSGSPGGRQLGEAATKGTEGDPAPKRILVSGLVVSPKDLPEVLRIARDNGLQPSRDSGNLP